MNQPDPIRIVLADDHEIFRDGLKLILSRSKDVEIVGNAGNGEQLVALCRDLKPDVVLTDIKMPVMDGIESTRILSTEYPDMGIIALSMFDEENLIVEMLDCGAKGYLLKNSDKNEIIEAIHAVANNETYYCRQTSAKLAQMIARNRKKNSEKTPQIDFSDRELDIIRLIYQEHTNKEIADKLFLSVRTVEGYRLKLLEKMNVKNSIGIVVYALQHGIININPLT
ncbi:MAG: response regulator transcription factor [Mucilaginibacter polytrichastri]|nr:response regulator transcription factor [Mucilaginibacter polytrichastri]